MENTAEPKVQIALYMNAKGKGLSALLTHYAIRLRTWSRYSHAELIVDGKAYSSSFRDGGVRVKDIEFSPNRWNIIDIDPAKVNVKSIIRFYEQTKHAKYDWKNIIRFLLPFFRHDPNRFVCFEWISRALNHSGSHRIDGDDLYEWSLRNVDPRGYLPGTKEKL